MTDSTAALSTRAFEGADRPALEELWARVFPDDPPWNAPAIMIDNKLKVQPELLLVGEIEGRLVGAVIAGFDGVRGWVYHLAVAPEWRRRGFASRLVRAAEDGLRQLGCLKVNLQVRRTNSAIVAFYESLGYVSEERVSMGRHLSERDEKPSVNSRVTTDVLQAFADAWNRHDVDAIMTFMTEDCVFEASAGPDVCGTRYVGRDAVRAGFAEVWTTFPDAHWGEARHFVEGERGVSEWIFTGTRADGSRVEVHGCDLFTFRDGKIALKNSYRKNRPPLVRKP